MLRIASRHNTCSLCQNGTETIIHALRDCPSAKATWHQLGVCPTDPSFFAANLKDWLFSNCNADQKSGTGQPPWHQVFLFAIWLIWKNRNQYIFKDRTQNPNVAKDIMARAMEYTHCACNHTAAKKLILKSIWWEKPNTGWMKLNMDGSSIGNLGMAGGGGVIRDEEGNWVIGYARKIGSANSFQAELWALRDVLLCVYNRILKQ